MIVIILLTLAGCLSGSLQTGTVVKTIDNPCTKEALDAGHYHHPYPSDPSKYIQCTEWGNYHVMSCYPGVWDKLGQTCLLQEGDSQDGGYSSQYAMGIGSNYAQFGKINGGYRWKRPDGSEWMQQQTNNGRTAGDNGQTQTGAASWRFVRAQMAPGDGMKSTEDVIQNQRPDKGSASSRQKTNQLQSRVNPQWFVGSQTQNANAGLMQQNHQQSYQQQLQLQQYRQQQHNLMMQQQQKQQFRQMSNNGMAAGVQLEQQNFQKSAKETNSGSFNQKSYQSYVSLGQASQNGMMPPQQRGAYTSSSANGMMPSQQGGAYKSSSANGMMHNFMKSNSQQATSKSSQQEWVQTIQGNTNGMLNILNPCRDANTQFVSNPTNPFMYWECVSGEPVERECPTDSVWIQRAKECRSLKQRLGSGAGQYQNPCLSHQKYLPYPGDSNKYIECIGWYRQEVRQCPDNHVWSQQHQVCVPHQSTAKELPVQPQPKPEWSQQQQQQQQTAQQNNQFVSYSSSSASQASGTGSELCQNSDSFYHPYPPKPNMYIQCDEFGNMYLRFCGPNKTWNDNLKTCVGKQTLGGVAGESGMQGQADLRQSGVVNNVGMTSEPFLCPDGSKFVMSAVRCVPTNAMSGVGQSSLQCPDGMVWQDVINGCVNLVAAAQLFNQIVPITCPRLYVFVQQDGQCRESRALSAPQAPANNAQPQCEPDFVWDPQMSMCIKKLSTDMFATMKDMAKEGSDDAVFTLRGPVLQVTGGSSEGDQTGGGMTAAGTNGMASSTYVLSSNGMSSVGGVAVSNGQSMSNGAFSTSGQRSAMVLTDMNGEAIHTNGQTDNSDIIPVSVEGDPCQTGDGFYHPYAADPRYFIQCDEFGKFFVHPCGYSLVWDQQLSTCIPWSVMLSAPDFGTDGDSEAGMSAAAKEGPGNQATNPCVDSEKTFFDFPYNEYLYIMCVGSQPYVMPCPAGLVWDSDVQTCVRT